MGKKYEINFDDNILTRLDQELFLLTRFNELENLDKLVNYLLDDIKELFINKEYKSCSRAVRSYLNTYSVGLINKRLNVIIRIINLFKNDKNNFKYFINLFGKNYTIINNYKFNQYDIEFLDNCVNLNIITDTLKEEIINNYDIKSQYLSLINQFLPTSNKNFNNNSFNIIHKYVNTYPNRNSKFSFALLLNIDDCTIKCFIDNLFNLPKSEFSKLFELNVGYIHTFRISEKNKEVERRILYLNNLFIEKLTNKKYQEKSYILIRLLRNNTYKFMDFDTYFKCLYEYLVDSNNKTIKQMLFKISLDEK